MKKPVFVAALALLVTGCAINPPPPPACVDDGRGMFPLNPEMLTQDQIEEGNAINKPEKTRPSVRSGGQRNGR